MQVVADDSGCKGQGPHIVIAGLIGPAEQFAQLADKWDACLKQTPVLSYFKMYHAAHRTGPFAGFTEKMRDKKLIALTDVLNEFDLSALHVTVDLDAHERHMAILRRADEVIRGKPMQRRKIHRVLYSPYFYAFNTYISAACFHLWEEGLREPFEFIPDEHPSLGPDTRAWYRVVRLQMMEPMRAIMPIDLTPKTDGDFLPLQAADLIAWFQRSENDKGHKFDWLGERFTRVKASDRCFYASPAFFDWLQKRIVEDKRRMMSIETMIELARLQGAPLPPIKRDKPEW